MLIEETVIVQVLKGAWLPPGSKKLVNRGGQRAVGKFTADQLVRKWPDRYKILKVKHGKNISPSKKQHANVLRKGKDLDLDGSGSVGVDTAE